MSRDQCLEVAEVKAAPGTVQLPSVITGRARGRDRRTRHLHPQVDPSAGERRTTVG
jgi:hypothetical protein